LSKNVPTYILYTPYVSQSVIQTMKQMPIALSEPPKMRVALFAGAVRAHFILSIVFSSQSTFLKLRG